MVIFDIIRQYTFYDFISHWKIINCDDETRLNKMCVYYNTLSDDDDDNIFDIQSRIVLL